MLPHLSYNNQALIFFFLQKPSYAPVLVNCICQLCKLKQVTHLSEFPCFLIYGKLVVELKLHCIQQTTIERVVMPGPVLGAG